MERNESRVANNNLLSSSAKMASATFVSRILGLIREQAMAAMFGASGLTDAFLVAYRIPNMLRDLFAEGAFSSAFVPVFTEEKNRPNADARGLMWSTLILLAMITSTISILIIVFAPTIIGLIAPSFSENIKKFDLTVGLIRLMSPFLTLISIAALLMGTLNSLKIFFIPALAPAFFNVVMIGCIIFLPDLFKAAGIHPVYALAVGVLGGGAIQLLVQLPLIFKMKMGFGSSVKIQLVSTGTKKIINRLGIGTFGIAANQINILVTTMLATGTVVGAVSWLTYAFRLFQFPVGILGVSIAGSNLVHFSDAWKLNKKEEAIGILKGATFLSFLVMIPAMCLLWAQAGQSIHLIFERGAFSAHDTEMSTIALKGYLVALPFYGLYKIFAPTFYALDKPVIPVGISIFSITTNIIFCLYMAPRYGFQALAWGTSLSMFLNCILQIIFLTRLLEISPSDLFGLRHLKCIVAGVACYFSSHLIIEQIFNVDQSILKKVIAFCVAGIIGGLAYAVIMMILGEWKILMRVLKRKD